jgi:NADPH-dependent curcumin reductase CurA
MAALAVPCGSSPNGREAKTVWLRGYLEEGLPGPEHFEIVTSLCDISKVEEGGVAVEVRFMSVDPYLRGGMKKGRAPPGASADGRRVMEGYCSGVVVASKNVKFAVGDFFGGSMPFATLQVLSKERVAGMWQLTGLVPESKLSYGVGVLGMPGSTAYGGIVGVLRPKTEGETIFISAASGAVGSLAGQIAKNVFKLKTVGTAGGADKCRLCEKSFGYDLCIDYRQSDTVEKLVKELKSVDPAGVDMYFENVGGMQFDAAFQSLKPYGRIAICGSISSYNDAKPMGNTLNLMQMTYSYQRIEGFTCRPWLQGKEGHFFRDMSSWLKAGQVSNVEETFYDGVEQWPVALRSLFETNNNNKGKVVVRV